MQSCSTVLLCPEGETPRQMPYQLGIEYIALRRCLATMECTCCGEEVADIKEHMEVCPDPPSTTSMTPDWDRFEGPLFGPAANAQRRE